MKKIYLLFVALLVITCAKEEDPIVTPPAVVIPPPSFVIPPVTSPETSTPPSYDGGDISISSREDLDYYREINVQNITGNFELNLDWTYVDNSTSDPSVFTKNIQTVTGDVSINVSTNEEVSLENLLKVGGNYSVTGADVIDDNLLYAKSISLDYEDNYEIKTVYTNEIKLNVGKWKIKKNKSFSTSKNFLGNISMTAYHTDLFNLNLEDVITGDVSGTTYIDSLRETLPVMPDDNPVYTEFRQISDEPSTSGSIISDNISSITIGGHINVNKITSESCTEIKINNTELPSIEVVSTSVVTFEMPNLIELFSIILNLPKVDKLEFPLLVSITNISVTGVNEFSSPLLETIKGNFTLSGVRTAGLPKLETLGGISSLPSNVNLTTGSGAPTLDRTGTAVPTGGASTGSGTSSSVGLGNTGDSSTGDGDDTEHNSGGSGDTPHNSGGSGDTAHDSGGSSGQADKTYVPDDNFEQYLIDAGYDDVLDNYVLTSKINSLTTLGGNQTITSFGRKIVSLTGIEDFTELQSLYFTGNEINSINISNNLKLESVSLNYNNLESIDLKSNTALKSFSAIGNPFKVTTIDISNNLELESFLIGGNSDSQGNYGETTTLQSGDLTISIPTYKSEITSIDFSNNSKLSHLVISDSKLVDFDTSGYSYLGNIERLSLSGNNISSIDLSNFTELIQLNLFSNKLTLLDISMLNELVNSPFASPFSVYDNPNLNCITVSQNQLDILDIDNLSLDCD